MSTHGTEGKLPSVAELQGFIKNGERLKFKTIDGGTYVGTLRWFDEHAFALTLEDGDFTLLRVNVIGYGSNRKK